MPDLLMATIAQYAKVPESRRPSEGFVDMLGGGLEQITATLPALVPIHVVVGLAITPAEADRVHAVELFLHHADGGRLAQATISVQAESVSVDSPGGRSAFYGCLPLLAPIQHAGNHEVVIVVDSQQKASLPLQVLEADSPPEASEAAGE